MEKINLKAPDHFNDRQKYYFDLYGKDLNDRHLLTEADLPSLERISLLEVEAEKLLKQISEEGATITDKNGDQRRSGAVMALANLSDQIGKLKKVMRIGAEYRNKDQDDESDRLLIKKEDHDYLCRLIQTTSKKFGGSDHTEKVKEECMKLGYNEATAALWANTQAPDQFGF
jgi:phage terminase small subunit